MNLIHDMEWGVFFGAITISLALLSAQFSLGVWITRQFSELRNLVYGENKKTRDELVKKFDYHEKHDDVRFSNLSDDIWELRVRNASIDGLTINRRKLERTDQCQDNQDPNYLKNVLYVKS